MVAELVPKPVTPTKDAGTSHVLDFNSAYQYEGLEGVETLLRNAQRVAGVSPPADAYTPMRTLYTIAELGNFPPPSWLVPGEIPAHGTTLLYGASGCGKSFLAVWYAMQIAREHRQPVVYIAAEGASGYHDRASAWCKLYQYSGDGALFDVQPLPLRDPEAIRNFIDTIKLLHPALVVIDTLARCMLGLDENSARDMGIAVEACATIIRETGAAVMLVHHTGKNGIGERGSSALFAACDSVIALSNEDGLITVSSAKTKDGKQFAERYMRLVEVQLADGRSSCVVLPSDRVITKGAPLTVMERRVLETLALEVFIVTGARAQSLMNQSGVSERSIYRILSKLMRDGYIRQAAKGDPYFIEEKGLELVQLPPLPNTANDSPVSSTTALLPLPHSYKSGSGSSRGSSPNGGQETEENNNSLPHLDAITKPLHGSNGNGRHG